MWLILLVIISVAILIIVFFVGIYTNYYNKKKAKLLDLVSSQDRSAKMLIRRDIELTRANEKLKGLDVQKSEFMSIIAHQMRTPLSAVKWTLDMIIHGELGPLSIDQINFLTKAEESNEHMIGLVEDMLLADRLETGKSEMLLAPASVDELIGDVLHDLTAKIEQKNIQIHRIEGDPLLCTINIDKEKIRAVIQNILENAIKYTMQDGDVTIHVYSRDEFVFISVKDSGIGIPKDQQAYIFGKFYRARNASRIDANGSGLGLFIAKNITERHGGTIACNSEEGKGTTFIISIKKT
jgi:signal transduction histidine kinase